MLAFVLDDRAIELIKQTGRPSFSPFRDCEAAVFLLFEQFDLYWGAVGSTALSDLEKDPTFRKVAREVGNFLGYYFFAAIENMHSDARTVLFAAVHRSYTGGRTRRRTLGWRDGERGASE